MARFFISAKHQWKQNDFCANPCSFYACHMRFSLLKWNSTSLFKSVSVQKRNTSVLKAFSNSQSSSLLSSKFASLWLPYIRSNRLFASVLHSMEDGCPSRSLERIPSTSLGTMQHLIQYLNSTLKSNCENKCTPPSLSEITEIRKLFEALTIEDLGYTEETLWKATKRLRSDPLKPTCVMVIYQAPYFELVAFILPKGHTIELHDHSGMVVISKLLLGSIHMLSLDMDEKLQYEATRSNCVSFRLIPPQDTVINFCALPRSFSETELLEMSVVFNDTIAANASGRTSNFTEVATIPPRGLPAPISETTEKGSVSAQLAQVLPNQQFPSSIVLLPSSGNIHRMLSRDSLAVVVEFVTPPYDMPEERVPRNFKILSQHKGRSESDSKLTDVYSPDTEMHNSKLESLSPGTCCVVKHVRSDPGHFIRLQYRGDPT